jgi:hypothetical protein
LVDFGVGAVAVGISVGVTTTAPMFAIGSSPVQVNIDAALQLAAATVLLAAGAPLAYVNVVRFFAHNGTGHVEVQLRYADRSGLDVPVIVEVWS